MLDLLSITKDKIDLKHSLVITRQTDINSSKDKIVLLLIYPPFAHPSPLGALKALGGFLEGDQGRTDQLPLYAKQGKQDIGNKAFKAQTVPPKQGNTLIMEEDRFKNWGMGAWWLFVIFGMGVFPVAAILLLGQLKSWWTGEPLSEPIWVTFYVVIKSFLTVVFALVTFGNFSQPKRLFLVYFFICQIYSMVKGFI